MERMKISRLDACSQLRLDQSSLAVVVVAEVIEAPAAVVEDAVELSDVIGETEILMTGSVDVMTIAQMASKMTERVEVDVEDVVTEEDSAVDAVEAVRDQAEIKRTRKGMSDNFLF